MDILTLILALVLAYSADFLLAGVLNWPAFGANLAIAFIGSRIVYLLKKGHSQKINIDGEKGNEINNT